MTHELFFQILDKRLYAGSYRRIIIVNKTAHGYRHILTANCRAGSADAMLAI